MNENSRHLTAFTCPFGLYEYVRVPFGLKNAVSAFQRSIENSLDDLRDRICMAYVDDTLCYSLTFDDHLEHVKTVLSRLISKGIKLNPVKCQLFMPSISYLGRLISKDGYSVDKTNIESVSALKHLNPSTVGDVRKLLGLLSYYRRYIQGFAKIAHPIHQLLKANNCNKANKSGQAVSSAKIVWTQECQSATEYLIDMLVQAPIMAYPDFEKPFIVHCDASGKGLGAILYQLQEGRPRVIAYASRALLPPEQNYHSSKLEFLCLKWAVTEHFRNYLFYAKEFEVVTDNNPLLYCLTTSKLNATTVRWVSDLADFNFKIKYRPGPIHQDVDTLSRLPLQIDEYMKLCGACIDMSSVDSLLRSSKHAIVGSVSAQTFINSNNIDVLETTGSDRKSVSIDDFRSAQSAHPDIRKIMDLMQKGKIPSLESK